MAHLEGLTRQQADELEDEWRQLGATNIRRTDQGNGLFTMDADVPGAPALPAAPTPRMPEMARPAAARRPVAPRARKPR